MALNFRALAAAAALAIPATTLLTLLPSAPAAEAAGRCAETQATITFITGLTRCQEQGQRSYSSAGFSPDTITTICAGRETTVIADSGTNGNSFIRPGQCLDYVPTPFPLLTTITVFS